MIPWLNSDDDFPEVHFALTEKEGAAGLLAAGGDLSPRRLLQAYRKGIFPWYSEGQPILWWSTHPRMVLFTSEFKISRSLQKTLRKALHHPQYQFCFDKNFEAVIRACSQAPRQGQQGTWINEDMMVAYIQLHHMGYAHSSEVWYDNELVGGAYGINLGKMFFGESMFARRTDASKMALAQLVTHLQAHNVRMIDCQQETSHLASLGARPISRDEFIQHLNQTIDLPPVSF